MKISFTPAAGSTRKVAMLGRWLITALSLPAAHCSFVSVAAAQTPTEPSHSEATPVESSPAEPPSPLSTPSLVIEDPRREVPQHRRPHRTLLTAGLVMLGGSYAASVIVAAKSDRQADEKLFLPVVGPWLDLDRRECGADACSTGTGTKALLIGDGALQGLGALSLLLSFVIPEPKERPWYAVGSQKLYVMPQLGRLSGLSAAGEF